jgi:two-component sensor histidine kinase
MHPDDRSRVVESMARAVESGDTTWHGEFRYLKADGTYAHVSDRGTIIRDPEGVAIRFLGTMDDVTERKDSETRQRLLSREMAHRMNNTLAVVLGLMHQTRVSSTSLEEFTARFGARVLALANANSTLVHGKWDGVNLKELATTQLELHMQDGRLKLAGPHVLLPLEVAQPVALALHELATNAIKHGALSNKSGSVSLDWTTTERDDTRCVKIAWHEHGGPVPAMNGKAGLGSILIDQGIPGATVRRELGTDGLRCSIELPIGAVAQLSGREAPSARR